eukprot:jgi/Chlat1/4548/Chrsp29S00339
MILKTWSLATAPAVILGGLGIAVLAASYYYDKSSKEGKPVLKQDRYHMLMYEPSCHVIRQVARILFAYSMGHNGNRFGVRR